MSSLEKDGRVIHYLQFACRGIRSKRKRTEVRLELLSHLDEAVAEKCAEGLALDRAIEAALGELGPVAALSKELAYAHRPQILRLPFLAALLTCLGLLVMVFTVEVVRNDMKCAAQAQRELVATHRARFTEDHRLLAQDPAFDFPGKEHDAGPAFNDRIDWANSLRAQKDLFPTNPPLGLSKETINLLAKKDWLHVPVQTGRFDTSWLRQLAQYDHWDIFESGPLKRLFDREPSQNFWSLPIPQYQPLQAWAKLRLLQALRGKAPLEGFREVRQLGRLIYSQQLLISALVYVAILNMEREAYEEAVRTHVLAPESWTPVGKDETLRARRAMYGYPSLFELWTEPATLFEFFDGQKFHAGMCSAIIESIPELTVSRLFYSDISAHSVDLSARFTAIDDLLTRADSYCRLGGHFRGIWNHPELAVPWMQVTDLTLNGLSLWERFRWNVLAKIPYIRGWVGAEFNAVVRRDYISGPYHNILLSGEDPI